jgi:hypothetical protein
MKTVSMWAYSGGNREIGIHDVEAEMFDKLRPAFAEGSTDVVGAGSCSMRTRVCCFS